MNLEKVCLLNALLASTLTPKPREWPPLKSASSAPTPSTAMVDSYKELVTLATSAISELNSLVIPLRSAQWATTASRERLCPPDVLKETTMESRELLISPGVSLALLETTVSLMTVSCASVPRVTYAQRSPRSLHHASRVPTTPIKASGKELTVNRAPRDRSVTTVVSATTGTSSAQSAITVIKRSRPESL